MRRVLLVICEVMVVEIPDWVKALSPVAQINTVRSLQEGTEQLSEWAPDLILLDSRFDEALILEWVRGLRGGSLARTSECILFGYSVPVEQRIRGYRAGVDRYLDTESQSTEEWRALLLSRLESLNRMREPSKTLEMGNLKILPQSMQVMIDQEQVRLTQMELELLRYFIEHPNQVIHRGKLLGDLWPNTVVTDRTVDTHMANLRKKIRGFSCELGTIYGSGYILRKPDSQKETH